MSVNAIKQNNNLACETRCIVCNREHCFKNCNTLNNTTFLCQHCIQFCQNVKRDRDAVNVNRMSCSPSADVYDTEPSLTLKDPDALRAQIDTGADVSCTDQLHMLHQCRAFDEAFPSPIKMMGGL